jgi:D-3-phosphoglycerate dehydrogenase
LLTDPIDGDASVIVATLAEYGLTSLTPGIGQQWIGLAGRAHGVIANLARIDAAAIGCLTQCQVIARLGVGINNIDTVAAQARGIVVTNVPDYCRAEVSDHALALMLSLLRKLPLAHADVQRGVWKQLSYRPIRRLSTLTLGLVGFGRLAQALAMKVQALGMKVIAHDPYIKASQSTFPVMSLDELLAQADVVSLHAPLMPDTRGLMNAKTLSGMKRGSVLVNTSRGELVDEAALAAALDSGHLAGAALDVFATEPLPMDSPLRARPNVLLTPHMAFYSEESLHDLQRTAAEEVARVLSGEAPRHRAA